MSLRLGGDGAITGCSSLSEPALTLSGLTVNDDSGTTGATITAAGNAFLILDSSVGGTAGNQISFIDFKNNGNNQANLAVNEGVTGKPLEINSSTNNNISLVTGGGKVGIGTSSPDRILEIAGSGGANNVELRINATDGGERQITFTGPGSTTQTIRSTGTTDNSLVFLQGSTERLRINSSGNVGIGTNSPSAILDVEGNGQDILSLTSAGAACKLNMSDSGTTGDIYLQTLGNDLRAVVNSGERLRIDSNGNVGINETNPDLPLSVVGGLRAGRESSQYISLTGSAQGNFLLGVSRSNNAKSLIVGADGNSSLLSLRTYASYPITFFTNNSERMRIDSSGKVGIGTSAPWNELTIAGTGQATSANQTQFISSIRADDARVNIGGVNNKGAIQVTGTGTSSDLLLNPFQGNVGIGESSPGHKLVVRGGVLFGPINTTDQYQGLSFQHGKDSSAAIATGFIDFRNDLNVADTHIFADHNTDGSSTIIFGATAAGARNSDRRSEKMRITGTGNVCINRTTSQSGGQLSIDYTNGVTAGLAVKDTQTSGTGVVLHVVNGSGSIIGGISQNQSSTSFNTSSDYRLKENIVDLDGAIDRVKQLLPKRFNFINDADTTVDGFLAHETQTVVPEAVTGTHDQVDDEGNAVMQGIDQSKLVPLLTAALKEAIAEIETLKTKVATLEASA